MGNKAARGQRRGSEVAQPDNWIDRELAKTEFCDERLGKRFRSLLHRLAANPGQGIPLACEDWANTKAAYRFLDNTRVSEAEILAGHFQATRERAAATDGPILILHDTTEFSFKREDIAAVGITRKAVAGKYQGGGLRHYTACGILMHSSLAVTTEQLPLGLVAAKFWTRDQFKGTNALKKKINPTRVPIEEKESFRWLENLRQSTALLNDPTRCVHIGDRESDIYELFCTAQDVGTHFLLRTCVDRLSLATAPTPFPQRWRKFAAKVFIVFRCQIAMAGYPMRSSNSDSVASACCHPSANKVDIRSSILRSCTPQNGVARVAGSQSSGN